MSKPKLNDSDLREMTQRLIRLEDETWARLFIVASREGARNYTAAVELAVDHFIAIKEAEHHVRDRKGRGGTAAGNKP